MPSDATPHSTAPHTPAPEPDMNSSSSTLAQDPASPFSASFDPNAPTPPATTGFALALRDAPLYPIAEMHLPSAGPVQVAPGTDASALWAHRLSASFGAIADQIAAASKALATVPPGASAAVSPSSSSSSSSVGAGVAVGAAEAAGLATRMDMIESAQERLGEQLLQVQDQLARLQVGVAAGGGAKEQGDVTVVEVQEEGSGEFKSATEIAIEELQKKVDGAIDTIKLDQARLYARLHNATVTTNKMLIKAPTMANGKAPPNFPNTKGEFDHLTKERYEQLLKLYNLPIKGDTSAKREALREFIGLTPPN